MQNNLTFHKSTVVLKDGNSQLAKWSHAFEQRPTIGESIKIPDHLYAELSGYDSHACVTQIKLRGDKPQLVELELQCELKPEERPAIILNADRISKPLRSSAEGLVRSTLRLPLITWESSAYADPVVRFQDPSSGLKECPPKVSKALLDLIHQEALV